MKVLVLLCFVLTGFARGQSVHPSSRSQGSSPCTTCHSCEVPTKANPCLKACPRATMITVHHSPEEAPNVLELNSLTTASSIYTPVRFSHRTHAEMADMSGGCTSCHHYNPPGSVLSCKECHEVSNARTDLSKPGLKGAFHRQCMGCHRSWSRSTDCTSCHALKGAPAATRSERPPRVKEPSRIVYETSMEKGHLVTFFHSDHTKVFRLDCVDCHQGDSCARCHHEGGAHPTSATSETANHQKCSGCHDVKSTEGCTRCHSQTPGSPFNHGARTGFTLAAYHAKLSCHRCHGGGKKFTRVSATCESCHRSWTPDSFQHSVTGMKLNETHASFDCESCHPDRSFTRKPVCSMCHDDKTYPQDKPGTMLRK